MLTKTLSPITENCKICGKPFVLPSHYYFNPTCYIKGLCCVCNIDIMKDVLKKGHCILKPYVTK